MRISQKQLEIQVEYLNKLVGYENFKHYTPNTFILDYAYGGVSLHKVLSKGGSVSDVFRCGHIPKKELYYRIIAFIDGVQAAQKQ